MATTRRKQEGAFYTPTFITRYNVEQALGAVVRARFEALRTQQEADAAGTARKPLADPNAYDLTTLNDPQRKALIRFWEAWQEELKRLRILDLACGHPLLHSEWRRESPRLYARFAPCNPKCTSR